jgi:hypothetical protein
MESCNRAPCPLLYRLLRLLLLAPALAVTAPSVRAAAAAPSAPPRFTLAEVRADFDECVGIIERQHPRLFTDRAAISAVITAQRARLREGMTELEFLRVLAPVSHGTLCGHTMLLPSEPTEAAINTSVPLLPLDVREIGGRIFLVANRAPTPLPIGAEILSVNGHTAAEIVRTLRDCSPTEGRNQQLTGLVYAFAFPVGYHLLVDASERFEVSYRTSDDPAPRLATIPGVAQPRLARPIAFPAGEPNTFRFAPDHAVLTLRSFNFYDDASRARFTSFVTGFFAEVRRRGVTRLMLDLRNNGGGDPNCVVALFRHLIAEPTPYFALDTPFYSELTKPLAPAPDRFSGQLVVLINAGCFSSTGHLCALLKYHRRAVFVGEETAGGYACTDASETLTLGATKLRFRRSSRVFSAAVEGMPFGRGTLPDHPVTPTLDDYLEHRDRVREQALELLRNPAT